MTEMTIAQIRRVESGAWRPPSAGEADRVARIIQGRLTAASRVADACDTDWRRGSREHRVLLREICSMREALRMLDGWREALGE